MHGLKTHRQAVVCYTVENYSEGAQSFVEARLIDLIENPKLLKYLNKVDM